MHSRAPPVSMAAAQYVSRAVAVLGYVASMTPAPGDIRERERRALQTLWHFLGNSLPGDAQIDLERWHCSVVGPVEARMRAVAARCATRDHWRELCRRLEAAAEDARSLAEDARGVVSPKWWDTAACVEVLRAAAEGWRGGVETRQLPSGRRPSGRPAPARRRERPPF